MHYTNLLLTLTLYVCTRQSTSRQKRRSEAADDAGITRKRWAKALMAAQCVSAWVVSTCDKFDNRSYILKTGYQLETGLPVTVLTSLLRIDTFMLEQ